MERGKFIVFEGIEGSGKTVQTKAFCGHLSMQRKDVMMTEQPWEGDSIGKFIREELKDKTEMISAVTLQFLFIANRSNHLEKLIEPGIKAGKTVVSDRYWMSTAAYGSALAGRPEVSPEYFLSLHSIFLKPDIVFFIDVDPKTAFKRINERGGKRERFDKLDTLVLLRERYKELERSYGGLWITINGNKKVEDVTAQVIKEYNDALKE